MPTNSAMRGEGEQHLVEAAQAPLDVLGLLVGERLAGLGVGVLGEQRLDLGEDLLGVGAGGGGHGPRLEVARLEVELLGDGGVEQDEAAARVDRAVLGGEDAGELVAA